MSTLRTPEKGGKPADQKARDFVTGEERAGLSQSLFVRAGAGAGKTHCLQERVKNLLLHHDCKPEKLAVITFTTKAATEIKNRVRLAIETAIIQETDSALRRRAASLLDELNKSKMSTVHSFCLDLLKEYPVEFRIDPACQIVDERGTSALKREVRHLYYEAIAISDPRFAPELSARTRLEENFPGALGEDQLFNFFETLYENRELEPRRLTALAPDALENLEAGLRRLLIELIEDVTLGLEKHVSDTSDKLYLKRPTILKELAQHGITPSNRETGLVSFLAALLQGTKLPFPANVGSKGNYTDPDFIAKYKDKVKTFNSQLGTYRSEKAIQCTHVLLELYPLYAKLYTEFKRSRGLLDFADCLILLRDGLRDQPFLRRALQARFDAIIVDEFQDSDPLQAEILFHLASTQSEIGVPWDEQELVPGKLTFMGDPKQSIYGFARADIAIYLKVMNILHAQGARSNQVLSTNFRSLPGVVEFVNTHFSQIITKHPKEPFASPDYEAMQAFKASDERSSPSSCVQLCQLELGLASDTAETEGFGESGMTVSEKRRREAWLLASHISEEIRQGKTSPGDYLLLFRSGAGMEDYEEALNKHGIPALNTKTTAFLQLPEVLALISLLGLLVRPKEPQYLYAALRSLYFGYSDEELQALFLACEREPSLEKLAALDSRLVAFQQIAQSQDPLPVRFQAACGILGVFSHGRALQNESLLSSVVHLTGILEAELLLNGYNERVTVENLLAGALQVSYGGQKNDHEMVEEKLLLETFHPSKVRLMTVHASKGLESRFVFLVNPAANRMTKADVLVDRDKGEILPLRSRILGQKLDELPELVQAVAREEIYKTEEEKRVLYVAATRAVEGLYLVQYGNEKSGSFAEPLLSILSPDIAKLKLTLTATYLQRNEPRSAPPAPERTSQTSERLKAAQQTLISDLNERAGLSQAVTKSLAKDAEPLFKDNPDGRARGKEFGTLVHELMEWICRKSALRITVSIGECLVRLGAMNQTGPLFERSELLPVEKAISKFLKSELYQRLLKALAVMPEVAFQVTGVVHGVIDLVFEDEDGIHLVDWKSDSFSTLERAALVKAHYQRQIEAYSDALEAQLGQRVKSKSCVYLFE